jgi:hypothetical protein
VELDHVLVAVPDLAGAAAEFEARYGLPSVEGGRHSGWGTANRIVPLGDTYVELVAVVDAEEAADDPFGSWVARVLRDGGHRPFAWAVRTDELDTVSARLDLDPQSGTRARPDGTEVRWRTAGVEHAAAEPCLPFFIEWAAGTVLPGRAAEPAGTIERLELAGDPLRLSAWLGEHALPIAVDPGVPAVRQAVVNVGGRPVAIGD